MHRKFNLVNRKADIQDASAREYDILIIGGGITGAGIALDAVSRGFKTLLLEKEDFASGTSSKSTKLIHGGLRYLKQFEIGLVRETGRERAIVHRLAPHLVHPEKMLLPIVENGSFSKFSASLAIRVYDFLAGVNKEDRKENLSREETINTEPLLRKDILESSICYSEYRTDDARLTFEVARKAHQLGADVFNYCKVEELSYSSGRVDGVLARDLTDGQQYKFSAKHVVSAAGPWVDLIREKDHSLKGKKLRLTKGVHLVFDRKRFPVNQAIYFDDFKGRMLFAIPRLGVTYVGTTDTDYKGDLNRVLCEEADIEYILAAVNHMFEMDDLRKEDVISSWAGLRPLISEEGKSASEVSRKDEIFESTSGLLSIAGGKLTGYRRMAERIIDLVQEKDANLPQGECKTESLKLSEEAFKSYKDFKAFKQEVKKEYSDILPDEFMGDYMVNTYGKAALDILNDARKNDTGRNADNRALLKAELENALENEMCWLPGDFFNRRTGMLYFNPHRLRESFDYILNFFREFYSLDEPVYEKIRTNALMELNDNLVSLDSD